jgi:hypothetical protein
VTALRRGERLEEAGPQLSGSEVLEKLFTECRELASWLEGKGFDIEGILEEGEELLDNALWLHWLLRDVITGNCKLVDTWRGRQEGTCRNVEAMYFDCSHVTVTGLAEKRKVVTVEFATHVLIAEMVVPLDPDS